MKRPLCLKMLLAYAMLCLPLGGPAQAADDDQQERQITQQIRIQRTGGERYWLGIALAPLGDTLKAQLDIEGGVVVEKVLDDSPAETAGIKPHDVVIKLGEHEVAGAEDLLKAVRENKDEKNTVTIIRKGQARTLEIRPTKTPDNLSWPAGGGEKDVRTHIQRWLNNHVEKGPGQALRMHFVGPGLFADRYELELAETPEDLSITINKAGDKPAQIVVKQDGKTWEVSEESLDELPDEIAVHVKKLLGGGRRGGLRLKAFRPGGSKIVIERQKEDASEDGKTTQQERINSPAFVVPEDFREMRKSFEQMRRQLNSDVLQEIREELQSLRREVEKLQKSPE